MARLGQNFLSDPNLLAAIVRESGVAIDDVVLEVGGGEGVLSNRLAPLVNRLVVIELDRGLREALEPIVVRHGNIDLIWGDAMRIDFSTLRPVPTAMVANLPYSVATPVILRTISEIPSIRTWTVMVQREIGERLRAKPGSRIYGSPSVVAQLACEVRLLRPVGRQVFWPQPRVDSALMGLRRRGPGADPWTIRIVRGGFAHRRKTLAGSLFLAGVCAAEPVREALVEMGHSASARAESLAPEDFTALAERLTPLDGGEAE